MDSRLQGWQEIEGDESSGVKSFPRQHTSEILGPPSQDRGTSCLRQAVESPCHLRSSWTEAEAISPLGDLTGEEGGTQAPTSAPRFLKGVLKAAPSREIRRIDSYDPCVSEFSFHLENGCFKSRSCLGPRTLMSDLETSVS